ncbi:MAG: DNA-deoxyinosine glycosylase [Omnitrophica WOR_2 bacterium GWF2_38_59]|nr:MAG: DNA-deoxyinosine glycosylase [Omnitrophica WOR_2 bacterium GWA2_37_7]OGX25491.1 MAG: DNA-deoxyinosine glycosylase [Omnitrophica WOR_2 bacterium GWF2_38_59]OGX48117.1 MAG: DNA-deoxyinosine glycosylase [Omnitrophica WOR_2 bacterium RIFOXYA2_FULL_38_17]OGX54732.1 MAG: DNA-deoxyinosine glycosylase [Omnitrophica WOR_2 bacterium RIFOXYA12_FULL_38_10]OGX56397.1 MAG: DNA-deoxyinosine glycosylase [Omnitrophica WOR_2 bacterium RIFOXYC2_FULL_38_12]OGX58453.1 MAG: DNA-deoxyinosine glycosylase [Omn
MQDIIVGFPPIVNKKSKVLVLGSMPGVRSLELSQYYGHSQNHFWKIIAKITKTDFADSYEERVKVLQKNRVALWDVIHSCRRPKTSSDSMIRNARMNDFEAYFNDYPNIKKVFCNGKTSLTLFKKHFSHINMPVEYLPSTSPAFAKPLAWKLKQWRKLLD